MRQVNVPVFVILTLSVLFCAAFAVADDPQTVTVPGLDKPWVFYSAVEGAQASDTWTTTEDGVLQSTGSPLGYIKTQDDYDDFTLTFQYRWPEGEQPGKGGVLFRMSGEDKVWPRSLEAQINAGGAGDFWGLAGYEYDGPEDRISRLEHPEFGALTNLKRTSDEERPAGEWNDYKIIVDGPTVTLIINGETVNEATDCERASSPILLTSEGTPIEFRKFELTTPQKKSGRLTDIPPALILAHAHNDYRHERPLLNALDQGFGSVEADIFLVEGEILIGHDRSDLTPERTLKSLYLEPLRQRALAYGGRIHPDRKNFYLWIDQKTESESTYKVLHELLAEYADIVTSVEDDVVTQKAVIVILSGNRPFELVAAQTGPRYLGLDGRLSDLDSDLPAHLLPMISDNWRSHFTWQGEGECPPEQREKFRNIIAQAHASRRGVRFWATPESESLWRELRDAEVDLINTDQLERLRMFLIEE